MIFVYLCCFCSAMLQHEQSAVSIVFMLCKCASETFSSEDGDSVFTCLNNRF